jgi:hypothetical protein
MSHELVKARLNLYAVLQNIEELVRLDEPSAAQAKSWDVGVQFAVIGGPAATLLFKNGECRHVCGKEDAPIKLLFRSPKHLNDMFDGKAMPIPVKGFSRLGFLKNDFKKLTDRLEYFLKGGGAGARDEAYTRLATRLKLATAAYAARELAEFDPDGQIVAAGTPDGALQIEVAPDGPAVSVVFKGGRAQVTKGKCPAPTAQMVFDGFDVASRVLDGTADVFVEIAQGRLMLRGRIPLIDSFGLLLDRIPHYLS